jgi:hypothetical protein
MQSDFLAQFIGNPTRAQLLRVFIFDPEKTYALKDAAKRAGISPQAAGREIKVLEKWGVVEKGKTLSIMLGNGTKRVVQGKQKTETWALAPGFSHLRALSTFVHEVSPMQYGNVVAALKRSGKIATIVLSGSFMGDPSRPADMLIAGDAFNERRLEDAIRQLEPQFGREIRYAAFSTPEFRYRLTVQDRLIRDTLDFPHIVLLDKMHLL